MSTPIRQFSQYDNLRKALTRKFKAAGIDRYSACSLSNVLLKAFTSVHDYGKISRDTLVAAGVLTQGQFNGWREDMVRAGVLRWEMKNPDGSNNYNYFTPGQLIERYVLQERDDKRVSKRDFEAYRKLTDSRLDALESEIRRAIEHYDPPYTTEKRRKFTAISGGQK